MLDLLAKESASIAVIGRNVDVVTAVVTHVERSRVIGICEKAMRMTLFLGLD